MTEEIKSSPLLTLLQYFILNSLLFACNPVFYFNTGKMLWRHVSFTYTCFCHYRKYPNDENKINQLLSFMTDSLSFGTIQIWRNLNEHYHCLTSIKSLVKNSTSRKLLIRRKWTLLSKLHLSEAISWQLFKFLYLRL